MRNIREDFEYAGKKLDRSLNVTKISGIPEE
jgi:hypothetical protein